jgi:asparagine synthase (glutamine-hydrolysing)
MTAKMIVAVPPQRLNSMLGPLPLPSRLKPGPGHKLHKLAEYLTIRGPEEVYLRALSQWQDPAALVPGSHEPDTVVRAISELSSLRTATDMAMLTDLIYYLPDDILAKVDRASMAVSLEARVPLLDHRVVEFAWKLPLHFKIRDHQAKWILRQVLYRHVPAELVERPKMGFGVPIDLWLRGPLRPWAEDLLSPDSLRANGFFDVVPIRQKWEEHLSGARNWDYLLWTVLMFQDWYASTIRQPAKLHTSGVGAV